MNFKKSILVLASLLMIGLLPLKASAQSCDTLSNLLTSDTLIVAPTNQGGYVSGHNGYGDLAKADSFGNYPSNSEITNVIMRFAVAKSSGPNATFEVKVWDNAGPNGAPGNQIAAETVTYSSVVQDVNNNNFTTINFSNPVPVSSDFYVGIEFNYSQGDTVALATAQDRGTGAISTAWEKWDNSNWYAYSQTWQSNTSHAILPIVCQSSSSFIDAGIDSINRGEYTSYPQSQSGPISFSGSIQNYGNQTVTNPTLQVDVFDVATSAPLYNDSQSASSLNPGSKVDLSMSSSFTPPDTGVYLVRYISSIDENDANPANDTSFAFFAVDDSTYARDKFFLYGLDSLNGGYGFGEGAQLDMGQTFDIVSNDTLTSVSFLYSGDTSAAVGDTIRANIYNFSSSSGPGALIGQTEPYVIPDDSVRFITLSPQGGSLELPTGEYLVTVNNAPLLGYTDNIYTPGTIWENDPFNPTGWERIDTVQNGQFQFSLVLWPNLGPTSSGNNCQNFSASVSTQNEICGSGNGSASVSTSGGSPSYTYSWSNTSQTGSSISGLSAGTYTVTVTDGNNCTATATANISNNNVSLNVSTNTTDDTCGAGVGSASASVSNGTPSYSFNWSNTSQTGPTISNLSAGSYDVTATDDNGCTGTATANIANNTITLNISISATSTSCGSSTGSASASVSNGTPSYSYSWSNGQSGQSISGLSAGSYDVTVTDANGCTGTATATVSAPNAPAVNITKSDISCNGANDGSATAAASGGSGSYSYNWSNNQSGQTIDNLSQGSYTVTATDDSNNCEATAAVTINEPSALNLSLTTDSVTCNGGSDGSVTANVSGGTTPYGYVWSAPGSGSSLSGVTAGSYSVTVTDANNCTITGTADVGEPTGFSVITDSSDADCNQSNGSASVTSPTGSNYTYSWSNNQTGQSITVGAGTYTVTVTNANTNCDQTATVSVGNIGGPTISVDNTTDVSCNGVGDGSATVSGSGGTGSLTYNWFDSSSGQQNTGLSQGTYSVTVTDQSGCIDVTSVTIQEPQPLSINFLPSDVSCFNGSDGSVTADVNGGTTPYSYQWVNDTSTTQSANNLQAGKYFVSVTDANNCTAYDSVTIDEPNPLAGNKSSSDVSCNGDSDGSASVSPTGGTSPYSYTWSTGASGNSINNMQAGTYDVTITDANSCTINSTIQVNEPQPLTATITDTAHVDCNGNSTGEVTVSASGGTPSYEYSVDGGAYVSNNTFPNLSAGSKTIKVRDANSCTETVSVTVDEPSVLNASIANQTDVSCDGASDGSIAIGASGGTPPYTYSTDGSTFQTDSTFDGLDEGQLTIFVNDANNCQTTVNTTINEPSSLSLDTNSVTNATGGNNNGEIDLTVSGGSTPYSYTWSNDESTQDISGLSSGQYTVTVTDDNGCTATLTTEVDEISGGITNPSSHEAFKVYPNPTDGRVTIELKFAESEDFTMEVFNLLSQTVVKEAYTNKKAFDKTIGFNNEGAGVYYVKVTADNQSFTRKVVVNR